MSTVTVTDTISTNGSVTVDRSDVADTITSWYPEAPTDVLDVITDLQKKLNRHDDITEEAEYLGVAVENA